MNSTERRELKRIIARIQGDLDNKQRVKMFTWVNNETNELHEPELYISMYDYRALCRIIGIHDNLSVPIKDAFTFEQMRLNFTGDNNG